MDIIQLYKDFNVVFATEGKNCMPGWVNIQCPFCDDSSNHLGYNSMQDSFHCWKCGWHPTSLVIAKLINTSEKEAKNIILQYGGPVINKAPRPIVKIRLKAHHLPSNTMPLQKNHKRYLEKRGFDPDYLEREWLLIGTGPVSSLDNIDFKHRVIAPIIWDDQQVSFQGRDITDDSQLKYITCPKDRELIFHKHIIYGKQEKWNTTGIIVEGITDVWRLGIYSCCTFGIEYTQMQVRTIAKTFRRVAVVFDGDEPTAKRQATKLVSELRFRNVDAFRMDITGDPAAMKQSEADYLIKQLI